MKFVGDVRRRYVAKEIETNNALGDDIHALMHYTRIATFTDVRHPSSSELMHVAVFEDIVVAYRGKVLNLDSFKHSFTFTYLWENEAGRLQVFSSLA